MNRITLSLLYFLFWSSTAWSQNIDPFERLKNGVERFELSNGLRVVMYRRDRAPIFAGQTWVKVGGVDEVPGKSGVSHMLEHMAFKGTTTIGTKNYQEEEPLLARLDVLFGKESLTESDKKEVFKVYEKLSKLWVQDEFSKLYKERGGVSLNAGTSKDYTFYMISLPTSAFEFWCWMESERLLNPVFRQFYKEREVVQEERRMRTDDNPSGKLYETAMAMSFMSHPNRLPTIGWATDITKLTVADLKELYDAYYIPKNMVISLVGDLEVEKVKPMLEKYFGRIPGTKQIIPEVRTVELPQGGARDIVVEFDTSPAFMLTYHKPVFPYNPDDAYFAVLHGILSDGRSSLLYKELVEEKKIATAISTGEGPGERYPSVFYAYGMPAKGVLNIRLKNEVVKIFNRLKNQKVNETDIEAAKRRIRVGFISGLASNYGLARSLGHSELLWGDWQKMFELYELMFETTAEDVQRLVKTYFIESESTFVHLEKEEK